MLEDANLRQSSDKRLQPFWSSVLPNRIVKLNVYAVWGTPVDRTLDEVPKSEPIATTQVRTNQQGHFEYVFNIVSKHSHHSCSSNNI